MDFEKVVSLLDEGKIDDVKNVLNEFKPQFQKTVDDLKAYEGKFNEAVQTRDKAKERIKSISNGLGVEADDLTIEQIKEVFKLKADDYSKAEIANLQKLLADKEAEYSDKLTQSESRFRDKLIEVEIAKLGAGNDVVNDRALQLVIESLKDGATIDNGNIVYRDANGTTIRNGSGQPLSISEKMAQFKADVNNSFLFKATSNGGGGTPTGGNGGNGSKKRSEMSHAEKGKYIKEHGEEAYLKLPK
ncbi:hypothetical protein [Sulfurospirillum sp. UCH001]|uniref:hypothetical protein n=1 Tax=Sulfurospirillum sp. UCH001 TaxID=1581011 RepID=UPI00082B8DA7|nr:hypothetical protein [Sulfurospirillum sp. UCH001]